MRITDSGSVERLLGFPKRAFSEREAYFNCVEINVNLVFNFGPIP
jgi:hypothetical protein